MILGLGFFSPFLALTLVILNTILFLSKSISECTTFLASLILAPVFIKNVNVNRCIGFKASKNFIHSSG